MGSVNSSIKRLEKIYVKLEVQAISLPLFFWLAAKGLNRAHFCFAPKGKEG
jgi:hypothetical protein